MSNNTFQPFPKTARLFRECVITEKIDGSSAQVFIWDDNIEENWKDASVVRVSGIPYPAEVPWLACYDGVWVAAGSRNRWLTPKADNFGFAAWVKENCRGLTELGHGRHYGEWWGKGINRGYGLDHRRFSLFNTNQWCKAGEAPGVQFNENPTILEEQKTVPECCNIVPVLYRGDFDTDICKAMAGTLRKVGSLAAKGFNRPEGIVCYHTHSRIRFKVTLENDQSPKGAL